MKDIKLLPLEKKDIEKVRGWRNSPEVSKYMYTDAHITQEEQEKWFEKVSLEKNSYYWLIEFKGQKIGLASITDIDMQNSKCYWGFYIGETHVRSKGLGAKVEFKILSFVFDELGLNKLCGEVFSFNEKVIRMHEKFGFRREGYLRHHIQKNGIFHDVVTIGLLREEWNQLKNAIKSKFY